MQVNTECSKCQIRKMLRKRQEGLKSELCTGLCKIEVQ